MTAVGDFAMPQGSDARKAWWGVRYLSAVSAQAGFAFEETSGQNDVHSFDGYVFIRSGIAVSVQVKCTSTRIVRQRSYRIKSAWRKNWEGLDLPGYFVVVSVPTDTTDWIEHGENPWSTLLRSAAFWTRIDPLAPAATSITVHTSSRLTVETLDEWAADLMAVVSGFGGGGAS
jgi:hypothetical protein